MDITLAKQNNERTVKSYHCTKWNTPQADGHLTITTERVVFHGATKPNTQGVITNRIVQEAELKSISGLSSFYGIKVNWIWLVVGLMIAAGGMIGTIAGGKLLMQMEKMGYYPDEMLLPALLGLLLGLVAVVVGFVIFGTAGFGKAFFLNIYSSQSAGTPISLGNADRANHVLLSLCGQPTDQTDGMMKELGALITDLKTDKEEAFRTWKAR
jgi:hypothetical protein